MALLSLPLLAVLTTALHTAAAADDDAVHHDGQEVRATLFVNQLAIMELIGQLKQGSEPPTASCTDLDKLVMISSEMNDTLSALSALSELSQEKKTESSSFGEALAEVRQVQMNLTTSLQGQLTGIQHQLDSVGSAMEDLQQRMSQLQEILSQVEGQVALPRGDTSGTSPVCPEPFSLTENHCFFVNTRESLSWSDARQWCQQRGGDLAHPQDYQVLITELMRTPSPDRLWVGVSDLEREGVWVDVSGRPISMESLVWRKGNPRIAAGGQDCLELFRGSSFHEMNDYDCDRKQNFVCERQPL